MNRLKDEQCQKKPPCADRVAARGLKGVQAETQGNDRSL